MNKQINLFCIALVLSAIIFTSCPPPPEAVAVTGVSLSQSELTLNVNESVTLTATVSPENATNKNVSWSSSDETVATVDTNGVVKALKEGTATITVKTEDGEKTATCSVTITPVIISVTGVKLNYTQIYREQGESFILTATVAPRSASNKTVTWTTSNSSIATVDNGRVTMTGSTVWESATITATTADGGKTATCTVTVAQKPTASEPDANGFVTISAGRMPLGSDGSYSYGSYHVTLTKAYMICDHEVTQKEWQDVMENNPSYFQGEDTNKKVADGEEQENRPVEQVSWYDAIAYCNGRTEKENLKRGSSSGIDYVYFSDKTFTTPYTKDDASSKKLPYMKIDATGYRLPTDAEWEIAARGGIADTDKAVWAGTTDETVLKNYAWYDENSDDRTHEVKKKLPNGYGLYDMSGNVFEWCWDWYDSYDASATDPTGDPFGTHRVTRGGCWGSGYSAFPASTRSNCLPTVGSYYWGFRLARSAQ